MDGTEKHDVPALLERRANRLFRQRVREQIHIARAIGLKQLLLGRRYRDDRVGEAGQPHLLGDHPLLFRRIGGLAGGGSREGGTARKDCLGVV